METNITDSPVYRALACFQDLSLVTANSENSDQLSVRSSAKRRIKISGFSKS